MSNPSNLVASLPRYFWQRLIASIVDGLLWTGVTWVLFSVTGIFSGNPVNRPMGPIDFYLTIAFIIVFAFLLARFGTTPGKLLFRLSVRDINGAGKPNMAQAVTREFFKSVAGLIVFLPVLLGVSMQQLNPGLGEAAESGNPEEIIASIETLEASPIEFICFLIAFAILLVIIFSLMRWRGQIIYDRFAGTAVVQRTD